MIAATGYRTDVRSLAFLGPEVRAALARSGGSPLLGPGLVSSAPGLYFTGLPAAASFGPVMRFVVGTAYASPRLTRSIAG